VSVDGIAVTETLDGKSMAIDPGPHVFVFESVGKSRVEERVIVREGERNRLVAVVLHDSGVTPRATTEPSATLTPRTPAEPSAASTEPPQTSAEPAPASPSRRPTIPGYIVGGAGVAAIGVASYFWATGTGNVNDLRGGCGKTSSCSQSAVDSAREKLVIGDVTAGVGVAAIGVGVYLIVAGLHKAPAQTGWRPTIDFVALARGGAATLAGAF
jgi:hypothetical protein